MSPEVCLRMAWASKQALIDNEERNMLKEHITKHRMYILNRIVLKESSQTMPTTHPLNGNGVE
jgi:hypothetical protein